MRLLILPFILICSLALPEAQAETKDYFIKKMLCSGTQADGNPVDDDEWAFIGVKFIQFQSQKSAKNGGGFAWSLGTGTCFEDSPEETESALNDKDGCGSSVWFSGLLKQRQEGDKTIVFHNDRDDLDLEVKETKTDPETGAKTQYLEGKFWYWGTKSGSPDSGFNMKCTAELYK